MLSRERNESWVRKAGLRPFIKKMDPGFHESSYGFATFNDMLASMTDIVETRRGEFDHELRLRSPEPVSEPVAA